jgi:hypothetical protein
MSRCLLVLTLALAASAVPLTGASAQEQTKHEVIVRSAEICKHGRTAMKKHVQRAARALEGRRWNAFARHGRRYARVGIRHVQRLRALRPPPSRFHYLRFVARSRSFFGWIDLASDAFADRRFDLAKRRNRIAARHASRAQSSARKYGLRPACVKFLEP